MLLLLLRAAPTATGYAVVGGRWLLSACRHLDRLGCCRDCRGRIRPYAVRFPQRDTGWGMIHRMRAVASFVATLRTGAEIARRVPATFLEVPCSRESHGHGSNRRNVCLLLCSQLPRPS